MVLFFQPRASPVRGGVAPDGAAITSIDRIIGVEILNDCIKNETIHICIYVPDIATQRPNLTANSVTDLFQFFPVTA